MEKSEIITLFERYKRRECTAEEIRLLQEWLDRGEFGADRISQEEIRDDFKLLEARLPLRRSEKTRRLYRRIAGYAASIALVLGIAYYYYPFGSSNPSDGTTPAALQALEPGSNKAILQRSDGTSVVLDTLTQDRLVNIDGAWVKLTTDGQLIYQAGQASGTAKQNQIITPKGGQYEVRLADGTQVWLNAGSKLSFFNNYDNQPERHVALEGEAYFKVSKNADQPFVVSVNDQHVKVLGTEFNVNAYGDNTYIKTSLVEGSVLFNENRLKPGESAIYSDEKVRVIEENMDDIIAWKNGYFVFFEESLEEVMKKISRWYDIDVSFADEGAKSILFGGSISKYENASQVFKMIEKAGDVKITVQNRKVIVNKVQTTKESKI